MRISIKRGLPLGLMAGLTLVVGVLVAVSPTMASADRISTNTANTSGNGGSGGGSGGGSSNSNQWDTKTAPLPDGTVVPGSSTSKSITIVPKTQEGGAAQDQLVALYAAHGFTNSPAVDREVNFTNSKGLNVWGNFILVQNPNNTLTLELLLNRN